jgi:hypothetical protein
MYIDYKTMSFFNRVKGVAARVLGATGQVIRRVGGLIKEHHQPISALINAATSQSENPYVKAFGSAAVLGSAAATRMGVGKNYGSMPPFNQSQ